MKKRSKNKKRRLKKKIRNFLIGYFITILIIVIFVLIINFIVDIKLIGDEDIVVNYGDKYSEPGYKAKLLGKDITNEIKVNSNVSEKIGKYKIIYSYKLLFFDIKKSRQVTVDDLSGPKIELVGDTNFEVTIGDSYKEAGYKAIDNLDGDVTKNVKVLNDIDASKLGEYTVLYKVSDKKGNVTKTERKVKVVKKKPTQMSLTEYTLDGWYDDVKLKETKDYGDDYFNRITMVGDSNTMNMYLNGYLTGLRAWAIPCLHAESMHHREINLYGLGIQMRLLDAVDKYKPEIMILNFGTFSTTWIDEQVFLDKANSLIEEIKKISPNTKLILVSIYPIRNGENINKFTQEKINKYNYYILEMAYNHKLKYLDVQEVLKGNDGYGNPKYFVDDKFHLTLEGHSVVKKYIRTHALEEE